METIIPKIDTSKLKEKANEYAQKGAEETIREFYTGYNSPYKEAIKKGLENKGFDHSFELPDVIANINRKLSQEIDRIANTAIAHSFVPMVTEFLTREESEMNFSKFLEKIVELVDFEYSDLEIDDFEVDFEKEDESFVRVNIRIDSETYDIGFSNFDNNEEKSAEGYKQGWTIYTLPHNYKTSGMRTMSMEIDGGAKLEMPFTPGVLDNKVVAFVARLIMANTKIYFDTRDFDREMFPEICRC